MDPYYSLSISQRTRSCWEERATDMARAMRDKEKNRNDNVGSSSKKKNFVIIFDDSSDEEEEEEKSKSESCLKRRRFDDIGSSANPYSIDDDDDDDDRSRAKITGRSNGHRSNGRENRSVEKRKKEKKKNDKKRQSFSSSSSSFGFQKLDSPSEEFNEACTSSKNKSKKKKKNEKKKKNRQESSFSSDGYRMHESPVRVYTKKTKKRKQLSDSDSDSDSFRISKKRDSKSKEPRNERPRKRKKASSDDDEIRKQPSDSDSEVFRVSKKRDSKSKEPKNERPRKRKKASSSDDDIRKQPSDSDSEVFRVSRKRDSKSKEPRNEKPRRRKKASSSDDDDDDDDDEETESESNTVAKTKRAARITRPRQGPKSKLKSKRELESGDNDQGPKSKAKKKKKSGGLELFKVLVNSMTDAGKDCVEDLAAPEREDSAMPLPLKFSFPEKPVTPEKSEYEKEIDPLWTDLRVALASDDIGSAAACRAEGDGDYDDDEEEDEDAGPDFKLDLDVLCERGKHQERLDDENGLYCSNCLKTITRIQDIYPSFGKNTSGRSRYRDPGNAKRSSFFEEFGSNDSNCNNLTDTKLRANAKTVWDMIPGVKRTLYPHQQEGFEFLWKHIAGGIERKHFDSVTSSAAGRGCIISHAPGTGKTLLTIVFLRALMKLHPKCLPIIIAPCSMLLTWGEEFRKWKFDAPFHNLNSPALSGSEYEAAAALFKRQGGGSRDVREVRALKLYSWRKGGSVLGVSYTTFEKLASPKADPTDQELREILLNSPDLLVLDEGHIPRNENSLIYQVLERVKTRKRIMLSGTPFQNNFEELYNTMEMVNPGFSKTQMAGYDKSNNRASQKKAARKDWKLLTKSFGEDSAQLNRIKAMIDPFVHIHQGEVLEKSLLGVKETIVVLNPTELQKTILEEIQKLGKEPLQRQWMVSLISIHPSLATEIKNESFSVTNSELNAKRLNPDHGVKMKFLMGLIRLCDAAKERVLVFSQYLDPLSLVMEHLKSEFGWNENNQVLYIDGKREMKERQSAINKFNDPDSSAKVFLVSTKAGGEGINLVGASRVVLLDVVWNPSVERQATRRAYRLGQKKFVFIYHLVASGTMEEDKYSRQVTKEKWSKMVFSSPGSDETRDPKATQRVQEDKVLNAMVQHENLKGIFEMIENKNHSGFLDPQAASSSNSDF